MLRVVWVNSSSGRDSAQEQQDQTPKDARKAQQQSQTLQPAHPRTARPRPTGGSERRGRGKPRSRR
eukprot:1211795-Prymnesium_polylepis.1